MQSSHKSPARRTLGKLVLFGVVAAVWIFYFFPIYWMVTASFKTRVDIFAIPPKWFFIPTLQYYLQSFSNPEFLKAVQNSLLITGATVVLSLFLGGWAAYAFARLRFKGSTALSFSLIIARMMPPIVFIVPLFLMLNMLKLRNTYTGLILIFTTFNLPFTVWMLKSFFEEVPIELEEAAWIDGASRLQALGRIILPLIAPGLAATAVFAALLAWNEFLFALLLGGPDTTTLPVYLSSFIGERDVEWGAIMATAVLTVVPPTILVMLVQRNLIKGLTLGAVKG
ncbi:MAG: carbohydrate ABC transporter permease [Chloroflexi bacterium]|nr:carbohydrate ABC transporter permease [Chloroflexota bacterium]